MRVDDLYIYQENESLIKDNNVLVMKGDKKPFGNILMEAFHLITPEWVALDISKNIEVKYNEPRFSELKKIKMAPTLRNKYKDLVYDEIRDKVGIFIKLAKMLDEDEKIRLEVSLIRDIIGEINTDLSDVKKIIDFYRCSVVPKRWKEHASVNRLEYNINETSTNYARLIGIIYEESNGEFFNGLTQLLERKPVIYLDNNKEPVFVLKNEIVLWNSLNHFRKGFKNSEEIITKKAREIIECFKDYVKEVFTNHKYSFKDFGFNYSLYGNDSIDFLKKYLIKEDFTFFNQYFDEITNKIYLNGEALRVEDKCFLFNVFPKEYEKVILSKETENYLKCEEIDDKAIIEIDILKLNKVFLRSEIPYYLKTILKKCQNAYEFVEKSQNLLNMRHNKNIYPDDEVWQDRMTELNNELNKNFDFLNDAFSPIGSSIMENNGFFMVSKDVIDRERLEKNEIVLKIITDKKFAPAVINIVDILVKEPDINFSWKKEDGKEVINSCVMKAVLNDDLKKAMPAVKKSAIRKF